MEGRRRPRRARLRRTRGARGAPATRAQRAVRATNSRAMTIHHRPHRTRSAHSSAAAQNVGRASTPASSSSASPPRASSVNDGVSPNSAPPPRSSAAPTERLSVWPPKHNLSQVLYRQKKGSFGDSKERKKAPKMATRVYRSLLRVVLACVYSLWVHSLSLSAALETSKSHKNSYENHRRAG